MLTLIRRVWYAINNSNLDSLNYRLVNRGYDAVIFINGQREYMPRDASPLELIMIDAGLR